MDQDEAPPTAGTSLPLHEEILRSSTRSIVSSRVRVTTKTETIDTPVELNLRSEKIVVDRLVVGRTLEPGEPPPVPREEDGVWIVPVLAETVVIERRLVLVEEVRMRRVDTQETETLSVPLRKQTAFVEREPIQTKPGS